MNAIEKLITLEARCGPAPWLAAVLSNVSFNPRMDAADANMFYPYLGQVYDYATTVALQDRRGLEQAMRHAKLLAALRNVAPELLAWIAANKLQREFLDAGYEDDPLLEEEWYLERMYLQNSEVAAWRTFHAKLEEAMK